MYMYIYTIIHMDMYYTHVHMCSIIQYKVHGRLSVLVQFYPVV